MQLGSADRNGAVAWSPLANKPNYLAVGTLAGTLDQNFNTTSHLEIFDLNFSNDKEVFNLAGKTSSNDRFNKLIWGTQGVQNGTFPMGLLVGGLETGGIHVWNPAKIIEQKEDPLVTKIEKHTGPVQALEFNPFVSNLLASGSADSEIFIYDISNTSTPTIYKPGTSSRLQGSNITCVAWNRKVQHILGSATIGGVVVVWDLKSKKPLLEFNDPSKKLQYRSIAWNPEEATQILTASADDSYPIIQIWDLRSPYTPLKVLDGHQGGVWSVSWCPMDSDLILSCGNDNRTICWNVRSGEIVNEVTEQSWNNDVQWSPRLPSIFSSCSFEGKVKIFTAKESQSNSALPGVSTAPKAAGHAPKWLKRPAGARFGFGGKLVSFNKGKAGAKERIVKITTFPSDPSLLERALQLQNAMEEEKLKDFTEQRLATSESEQDKEIWQLLNVFLSSESRDSERLDLLKYFGFNSDEIAAKMEQFLSKEEKEEKEEEEEEKTLTEEGEGKNVSELFGSEQTGEESLFESVPKQVKSTTPSAPPKDTSPIQFHFSEDSEGMITQALIVGNMKAAVDLFISNGKIADALVLAAYGGESLWKSTREAFIRSKHASNFTKVVASLVNDNLRDLVERSDLEQWKATLAILLTYAKKEEFALLSSLLGNRLHVEKKNHLGALICYVCSGHIDQFTKLYEKEHPSNNTSDLLDLIEKVTILRKVLKYREPLSETVTSKYGDYAQYLASQGELEPALRSLSFLLDTKYENTTTPVWVTLDRLFHAQGLTSSPPPFPFKREEVQVPGAPRQQPQSQPLATQKVTPPMKPPTPASPVPANSPFSGNRPVPSFAPIGGPQSISGNVPSFTPIGGPQTIGNVTPYTPLPPQSVPGRPVQVSSPPSTNVPAFQAPLPPPSISSGMPYTPVSSNFTPPPTNAPLGPPPTSTPLGPPPTNTPLGPPPTSTPLGPPPTTGPVSMGKTQPRPAEAQSQASSEDTQRVIDSFKTILENLETSQNDKVQKALPDIKKRLPLLFDKLPKLSSNVIQDFDQFTQAILNKNPTAASSLLQDITKNAWNDIGSAPMIAVKKLAEFI